MRHHESIEVNVLVRTAAKLEGDIVRGNARPKLENWSMRGNDLCHLCSTNKSLITELFHATVKYTVKKVSRPFSRPQPGCR
jgi:hypothetical protein